MSRSNDGETVANHRLRSARLAGRAPVDDVRAGQAGTTQPGMVLAARRTQALRRPTRTRRPRVGDRDRRPHRSSRPVGVPHHAGGEAGAAAVARPTVATADVGVRGDGQGVLRRQRLARGSPRHARIARPLRRRTSARTDRDDRGDGSTRRRSSDGASTSTRSPCGFTSTTRCSSGVGPRGRDQSPPRGPPSTTRGAGAGGTPCQWSDGRQRAPRGCFASRRPAPVG